MHILLVRGALIACLTVTGLIGTATTVELDGMSASVQTNSDAARVNLKENCAMIPDERPGESPLGWYCPFGSN